MMMINDELFCLSQVARDQTPLQSSLSPNDVARELGKLLLLCFAS